MISRTVIFTTIAFAGFLFSYLATAKESFVNLGTLGGATTAIIMTTNQPTLSLAANRFLEISIGILIATFVSQFILPVHARTHLLRAQTRTLKALRDFYNACMNPLSMLPRETLIEMDEAIVKKITQQRQLSKDAARELLGFFFDRRHFSQTLTCEKEILRAIALMHAALKQLQQKDETFKFSADALNDLNQSIEKAFNILILALERKKSARQHDNKNKLDAQAQSDNQDTQLVLPNIQRLQQAFRKTNHADIDAMDSADSLKISSIVFDGWQSYFKCLLFECLSA